MSFLWRVFLIAVGELWSEEENMALPMITLDKYTGFTACWRQDYSEMSATKCGHAVLSSCSSFYRSISPRGLNYKQIAKSAFGGSVVYANVASVCSLDRTG